MVSYLKKKFSVGVLIIGITIFLSACGNRETDYIKEYSKELKKALGDYTFVEKEAQEDFLVDGTSFGTTEYLEWLITYSTQDGSSKTFTLKNLNKNKSFYSQITDECIRNIKSEVKDIATEEDWTDSWADSMIVDIELDGVKENEKFMLYPAYTDLKTLTSQYDCTINIGVDYGFDVNKCKKTIDQLIANCDNKVDVRVYCDLLGRGDIDAFVDERFVDIYLYKNGECILENF